MIDRPIELPRWMRWLFTLANEAPWTNLKTMNALVLANGTGLYLAIAGFFRVAIDVGVLEIWLIFVAAMLGIAMIGAGIKGLTPVAASPANSPPLPPAVPTAPAPGGD